MSNEEWVEGWRKYVARKKRIREAMANQPDVTRSNADADSLSAERKEQRLLPCPFCGSTDVEYDPSFVDNTDSYYWGGVECLTCDAMGPQMRQEEGSANEPPTEAPAVTAWNIRAEAK